MVVFLGIWRVLIDYWIAPQVFGRELEIHPLLAIFTLMVGAAVGGSRRSLSCIAYCGSDPSHLEEARQLAR